MLILHQAGRGKLATIDCELGGELRDWCAAYGARIRRILAPPVYENAAVSGWDCIAGWDCIPFGGV